MRTAVFVTVGVPGAGKSYVRCGRFLVDDYLVNRSGLHVSNFPVNLDNLVRLVAGKVEEEEVRRRVRMIDREVLKTWASGESGPWETFSYEGDDENPLAGAHIAIDECHMYCGKHHSREHRKAWQEWLGEIRHLGATVEFLTQDLEKVANEIVQHCGKRLIIAPLGDQVDPLLQIPMSDWWQLVASLITREYVAISAARFETKEGTRWVKAGQVVRYELVEPYFSVYESFSRTESGQAGGKQEALEWERFSRARFVRWFCAKNSKQLLTRGGGFALFLFACFVGFPMLFKYAHRTVKDTASPPLPVAVVSPELKKETGDEKVEAASVGLRPDSRAGFRLGSVGWSWAVVGGVVRTVGDSIDGFGTLVGTDPVLGRALIGGRVYVIGQEVEPDLGSSNGSVGDTFGSLSGTFNRGAR